MLISCPHCRVNYEVEIVSSNTVLLCHRCGIEFSVDDQLDNLNEQKDEKIQKNSSTDTADPAVPEEAEICGQEEACVPEDSGAKIEGYTDITPPQQKKVRIWPWLMVMLILIFSAGFWLQKDAWLDNRWFRSTAINLGFSMQMRDKDWLVIPGSVQAEWITRDDSSKALLIRGRVKNLLTSEMPAPIIEVTFFSDLHPDQKLGSQRLIITLRPGKLSIHQVPYIAPEADTMPVMPESERAFVFLIESVPENTGDFTLAARVR
jgi:uncharacterized protein YbaR (Trm112 family)